MTPVSCMCHVGTKPEALGTLELVERKKLTLWAVQCLFWASHGDLGTDQLNDAEPEGV